MNKYQREKAKRMKKLSNLGVSYYCRKRIMRNYSLEQVDKMIELSTIIKNSGLLEKVQNFVKGTRSAMLQLKELIERRLGR